MSRTPQKPKNSFTPPMSICVATMIRIMPIRRSMAVRNRSPNQWCRYPAKNRISAVGNQAKPTAASSAGMASGVWLIMITSMASTEGPAV